MIKIVAGPSMSRIFDPNSDMSFEQYQSLRFHLSYEYKNNFFRKRHNRFLPDRKFLITEKRMEFQTGLLHRVKEMCDTLSIEYEVEDRRLPGPVDHFMPLKAEATMRDYQQDSIDAAVTEMQGMVHMATGGGKTRVIAGIIGTLERNAVVLVHRLDLMHQVLGVLNDLMLYPEVIGRVGGGVYEPNLVTVCTVQTICHALGINYEDGEDDDDEKPKGGKAHADAIREMLDKAQVMIVDEAHHAPARTISEVMKMCPNAAWRIGMSATDWRDDGADLLIEAAVGPRIISITISDLVDRGFLVPADIFMEPQHAPAHGCDSDNWQSIYKHFYTDNNRFHWQVYERNAEALAEGRHVLTLVTSVAHGDRLKSLHRQQGIECEYLSGRDTEWKRKEVLADVRAGRLRCLIGTSIADEGLDLPILDTLNLAGGGTSTTKTYQRIGRILRPYEGKERGRVYDYRPRSLQKLKEKAGRRASIYRKERCFAFKEAK